MKTNVIDNGRVVIPKEFRDRDGLENGQHVIVLRRSCGDYLVRRVAAEPRQSFAEAMEMLASIPLAPASGERPRKLKW